MGLLVGILISAAIAIGIAIPWANAIDRAKNDPEYKEHEDDPDYWEWP